MPNLADFFTVHGITATQGSQSWDGKININTAGIGVLASILQDDYETYAPEMLNFRVENMDGVFIHDLSGPKWYKNVVGLEDLEIDPSLITTASDLFRIASTASYHDSSLTVTAVIRRETDPDTGKWRCKVLRWQIE